MGSRNLWILAALAMQPLVQAQWLNQRTPGIPRTADGKPNLSARAPRASDGHPDLSGLWQTESASRAVLERVRLPPPPPNFYLRICTQPSCVSTSLAKPGEAHERFNNLVNQAQLPLKFFDRGIRKQISALRIQSALPFGLVFGG